MIRKRKIQFAAVPVFLGVIGWILFSEEDVKIVSVTASSTNQEVLVTVMNKSLTSYYCYFGWEIESDEGTYRSFEDRWPTALSDQRHLNARSTETFELNDAGQRRWRAIVSYDCRPASFGSEVRSKIAAFTQKYHMPRISRWIRPDDKNGRIAYGPPMFGNKPVAAEKK